MPKSVAASRRLILTASGGLRELMARRSTRLRDGDVGAAVSGLRDRASRRGVRQGRLRRRCAIFDP
ncbi:hypothetical protein [Kribbella sp. NPDC055071]